MSEPRVVVAHREHLWWLLAGAIQLEHMIMCQYLFAELSLKGGVDEGLTPSRPRPSTRWQVLRPVATELTTLPVGPAHPGRTAGFGFEMYYVMGNMTPDREASWALLAERARILAHRCGQVAHGDEPSPVIAEVVEQAGRIAAALTAQVPEALRPPPERELPW
jgi:hypothetical protein